MSRTLRVVLAVLIISIGGTVGGVQAPRNEDPPNGCTQIDEETWDCPQGFCRLINGVWYCE